MTTYRSNASFRDQIEDFAQRQPELFVAGVFAGGFLLGYFLKNVNSRMPALDNRNFNDTYQARFADRTQNGGNAATPPRSSARLGATEDQISRAPQQSAASAVSNDDLSTTGTAYELDPKSITGG